MTSYMPALRTFNDATLYLIFILSSTESHWRSHHTFGTGNMEWFRLHFKPKRYTFLTVTLTLIFSIVLVSALSPKYRVRAIKTLWTQLRIFRITQCQRNQRLSSHWVLNEGYCIRSHPYKWALCPDKGYHWWTNPISLSTKLPLTKFFYWDKLIGCRRS